MDSLDHILDEFKKTAYQPIDTETLQAEIKAVDTKVDSFKSDLNTRIDTVETDLGQKVEKALEIAEQTKKEKGEPGQDYVLTEQDKVEIAESIKVPVVTKVIEKVERIETVREIPIVTENKYETIKEVALHETGEALVNKINDLPIEDEYKIDASHIKNLPEVKPIVGGGLSRYVADSLYAPIGSTSDSSGVSESLAIAYAVAL